MSDAYLAEELEQEYAEKVPVKKRIKWDIIFLIQYHQISLSGSWYDTGCGIWQPIGNHLARKAANGANYGAYERRLFQNRDKYSDKIFVTINNNSNTEVWKACIQSGYSKRHRPPELWETGHWQGIRDTWGGSAATSRTKEPGIIRQCRSRAQGRINGSIK